MRKQTVVANEAAVRAAFTERMAQRGAAKQLADQLGVSAVYISRIGKQRADASIPVKVGEALGFRQVEVDGVPTWQRAED